MIKVLIATLISIGFVSAAYAQVNTIDSLRVPKSYWVVAGGGLSTLGSVSATLIANAEIQNNILLSGSWIGETNVRILDSRASHNVDVSSYNALAGKVYKQRHSLISFSAGLGLVRVKSWDSGGGVFGKVSPAVTETTVGIPLLIQAHAIGFQAVGVGLNIYGNLNMKQSTAGVHLNIALGRMTTRPRHRQQP